MNIKRKKQKITMAMTEIAYSTSQDVYSGKIEKQKALDYIEQKCGMARKSADYYIYQVKRMMDGIGYTGNNSEPATEYFLEDIFSNYPKDKQRNALSALSKHIEYQEKRNKLVPGLMKIVKRFYDRLNNSGN